MGLKRALLVGVVASFTFAGCGGSSHKSSSAGTSAPATTAAATTANASTSSIASRVLASNQLNGFTGSQPSVDHTVGTWVAHTQNPSVLVATETKRLTHLGFIAGATEDLTGPHGRDGLSLVEQFKTPGGAQSERANELKVFKATVPGYKPFPVPGVPGAFGYAAQGPGLNVAFASGDYYYLVGEFVSAVSASSEATIIAAAKRLYQRVQG